MNDLSLNELIRSREEKRILTGKISGIEDEFYKIRNELVTCAIIWYGDVKILIPSEHMGTTNINKSVLRGMIQAEIDFIVIEIDETANVAIASRKLAMELRSELELPKLNTNDNVRVRILSVGTKHIIVELYGKEVVIKAQHLKHTYIFNCKNYFKVGDYLKVRIRKIDINNNVYELDAKCFAENPYNNARKYIIENGEYVGKVVAFPKKKNGVIVQLDVADITCLVRVPANFNNYPQFLQQVLIRVTEIKEKQKLIYGYLVRMM